MSFDLQPVLEGKLVRLRPLGSDDFQDLYAVAADPLIWEQHPQSDRFKIEIFTEFFRGAMESGGALAAFDAKGGQMIGSSRFANYNPQADEVEIGWTFLARSHWGGDFNREMKHLMLCHAFRFVENVAFLVGPNNLRSQKAVEKIGGTRAGWRQDKSGRNNFMYRITAAAYRQSPLFS